MRFCQHGILHCIWHIANVCEHLIMLRSAVYTLDSQTYILTVNKSQIPPTKQIEWLPTLVYVSHMLRATIHSIFVCEFLFHSTSATILVIFHIEVNRSLSHNWTIKSMTLNWFGNVVFINSNLEISASEIHKLVSSFFFGFLIFWKLIMRWAKKTKFIIPASKIW